MVNLIKRHVYLITLIISIGIFICIGAILNFQKSDWASWSQSIGSIGAIFVAIWVVRYQHAKDIDLISQSEKKTLRRQLIVLNWIFVTIASTCEKCSKSVGRDHVRWDLEARAIDDIRKVLISIPLSEVPDPGLILRVIELSQSLQTISTIIHSLATPRSKEILDKVSLMLKRLQTDALTGSTEASKLRVKYSTDKELEEEFALIDAREANYALTIETLKELGLDSNPSS